jgi:hypothetical protein
MHEISGKRRCLGHLIPDAEPFGSESSVISGCEQVAARAEVRGDDSVHLDKTLSMPGGFKPSHSSLPFTRRLMRVLRSVVQVSVLPVRDAGHHDSFRRPVASEFVGHDHARTTIVPRPQQLAEEPHGGEAVALRLDQNIEDDTVLIDGPPEVMSDTVDLEEDLIQMPLVARPGTPSPQAIGELASKFIAPAPDCFIAHHHATCRHHLLYIAKADAEPEVQPHAFRDNLLRESMTTVRIVRHSFSIASHSLPSI